MKSNKLSLLILLFLWSLFAFSQGKPNKFYLGAGPEVPKKTNAIVRHFKTVIDIKSESKIIVTVEKVVTILDNEGKSNGVINWLYDDFSKLSFGNLWVYSLTGEILDKKRMSEMRDVGLSGYVNFYDDLRIKYYKPLIKKTPYTFHYKYQEILSGFFQLNSWRPQASSDVYVENASLEIINHSNIDYRYYLSSFIDSTLTFEESVISKTWKVADVSSFYTEKHGPTYREQLPQIIFPLESFVMDAYAGKFHSWKSFGQWSYELNKGRQDLLPETKAFIKRMTDTIEEPREKAKVIYNWMQDQTRYVSIQLGIGGWQSFTALEVDAKKYGDCKALSNYTQALLAVVDIESYYSLVNAGRGALPIDTNELSNRFNHAILCLPLSGDTTWLECTSDDTPFGYIANFTDNRYALLIKDQESRLVKTTSYKVDENILQRKTEAQITSVGGMQARLSAEYHNLQIEKRQFQFEEVLPDQINNLYEIINLNGFKIDYLNYRFVETAHPIIYEKIGFSIRKIATTTSSRMFFPLYYLNKKKKKVKKDTDRINEIVLRKSFTSIDTIVYALPEGYQIQSLPEAKEFSSDFGSYQTSISQEEGKILFVRKQLQNAGVYPATQFNDFLKYSNSIIKADKATVILEKL